MWTYMIVDGRLIHEYFEDEPPIDHSVYVLCRDGNPVTFSKQRHMMMTKAKGLNDLVVTYV